MRSMCMYTNAVAKVDDHLFLTLSPFLSSSCHNCQFLHDFQTLGVKANVKVSSIKHISLIYIECQG